MAICKDDAIFDITSGINASVWLEEESPSFEQLKQDIKTDICIIGAGIAGLSIAYHLVKAGQDVTIIEAKQLVGGESGRTTAHLSNAYDDRYYQIEKVHGEKIARLVAESHTKAIESIEEIIQNEKIDCDFKRLDGYLFLDETSSPNELHTECHAAQRAGLEVEHILSSNIKGFPSQAVLRFPNQGQFHPMKYLIGLSRVIAKKAAIYTQTQAVDIKPGRTIRIKTKNGCSISSKRLIIATNAPLFDMSLSFAKQSSYRTYVIAGLIPKDSLDYALYWDTGDPYHYIRLQPYSKKEDLIIIGGEDHRTGERIQDKTEPFKKLEQWSKQFFPVFKNVTHTWSGQVQEPIDYLAYIGRIKTKEGNMFISTGDSGNGITHGAIAGLLIRDLILNKKNPWEEAYDPHRSKFKNTFNFIKHNIKSVSSYGRYLMPGEVNSVEQIKPGEGKLVCQGLQKLAVYRDEEGELHEYSAVCTHLGAPLRWNPIEQSWDCLAHGSRFSPCGIVIQGPASKPLKNKEETAIHQPRGNNDKADS